MTRAVCLVAVLLLLCLVRHCLADKNSAPEANTSTPTNAEMSEAIRLGETAWEMIQLAKSAKKLADKDTVNATAEVLKSHARAAAAVKTTIKIAAEVEAIAKSQSTSLAAQRLAQDAKMAAEVAQELYGNATANPSMVDDFLGWFKERYETAVEKERQLTFAMKALEKSEDEESSITELAAAVRRPARKIVKLAQDAENDAKRVALERFQSEILAERIELIQLIVELIKKTAEKKNVSREDSCEQKYAEAAEIFQHRQVASKAHLYALSARNIAVRCFIRISKNETVVEKTYYEVKNLLAKVPRNDYKMLRFYQGIADDARINAEHCESVAESTPENADMYMKEAKGALDTIDSCVTPAEAKWSAEVARKASKRAVNEMQFATHQLFSVTLSVQQAADAKNALKSKATETDTKLTEPKESAVKSEKEAAKTYADVKAYADECAGKVHRIYAIIMQMKHLAKRLHSKAATVEIEEQLYTVKKALRTAEASHKRADAALSKINTHYNNTKATTNAALGEFDTVKLNEFKRSAIKFAIATKESKAKSEAEAKKAVERVIEQERQAAEAYEEVKKLMMKVKKATSEHYISRGAKATRDY